MSKVVQLNKVEHRNLKVDVKRSAQYGDNVMLAMTFPLEFRSVQSYYPILFKRDENENKFFAVSMFGLEEGENLFLDENGWQANYVPLMIERHPFLIGVQKSSATDSGEDKRVVHIDLDSKRIDTDDGERLFDDDGNNTPFLERTANLLETIHHWNVHSESFMALLTKYELLEQVTIDITLASGKKGQLLGFYTVNEEKLSGLTAEALVELQQSGSLQPIYMAVASLSNIRKLCDLKSKKSDGLPEFK
ncbi:hypothetical protein TDB9533_02737 [Thalassocella blandensis]|nr:hypothetical protein TDB9533_02737 [Thalassocella blandensis]